MKYTPVLVILALAVIAPNVAMASDVLDVTCGLVMRFWSWLRTAVYVLAAIGLALMSFQASIMGKFAMSNFVSWCGALFILAMTEPVIAYLTDGGASLTCNA